MIKLPRFALSTGIAVMLASGLTGCAAWGTHPDSVAVCERGFGNDPEWQRDSWPGPRARRLLRQFPSFEFNGQVSTPVKSSTLWFENPTLREVGSCSMHSCDTGRCVWRIRLYSRTDETWRIRSEYDIGRPHNLSVR